MSLRTFIMGMLLLAVAAGSAAAAEKSGGGAAAAKGKQLYIYGDQDAAVAAALVKEFAVRYPGITVDFLSMPGSEAFSRHMSDMATRRVSADILWLRDVTLQSALVKGGYALKYTPAADSAVPAAASISDTAFVVGFDPVVMVYNKTLVAEKELPLTRGSLAKALSAERWKGQFGTCDPDKNETALLLLTQDLAYGHDFWGLVKQFAKADLKVYPDYRTLLEKVDNGEITVGYNLPLSALLKAGGARKNTGWAYTTDYTLALPESLLITRDASNPDAARSWIEFTRSPQAQQLIAAASGLFPVRRELLAGARKDPAVVYPADSFVKVVGTGPEVTRLSEKGLKRGFILRWKQLLGLAK